MSYAVQFTPGADRSLRRLEAGVQRRIVRAAEALGENPRPADVKKLVGKESLWRIRVGDYRVVYQILDRVLVILIVMVGHRSDVYR